ncbi:MAG: hypothetical protein U0840_14230 [Gemmataceae bacterium]
MILKFPDLNTLRLALLRGAIPPALSGMGAVAGLDDQNQCWVELAGQLPKSNQSELKSLGVTGARSWGASTREEVSCWAEILPLERDRVVAEHLDQVPILFDVPSGEELSRLVIEILRLGNDRQGFRWLTGPEDTPRALLRVVGPPFYSLLRAMDRIGGSRAPVAYVERAPRVWVELGYSHPLIGQVKAPSGKLVLVRPPRQWTMLDDAPFRDVYEILEFPLPERKVTWKEGKLAGKIAVTPSLRAGGTPDGAELWVLRDNPIEELNRFVQNADDQLLQRLGFAVGEVKDQKLIVVRVRQSKQSPPVVVFPHAVGYKHYLKLPNLFLPVGTRLHPPLRRDQVRKLLAEDTNQVVWLQPGEKGAFTPMNLPEDSFRPLWDWIDYVLDHEKQPLQAWVQATQFDFEPFVSEEETTSRPRKPPGEPRPKQGPRDRSAGRDVSGSELNYAPTAIDEAATAETPLALDEFASIARVEPSQVQRQLRALEESFLALEGGLDIPERQEMWPQLALLNTQLQSVDDAGVCWMNALWERGSEAVQAWAWHWFLAEAQVVPTRQDSPRSQPRSWVSRVVAPGAKSREIAVEDLDRLLNLQEPATADLRALASYLVYAVMQPTPPPAIVQRFGPVSRFLEAHEKLLPVRAVWLAWSHLTLLSKGDVLALARARDRLLERLYTNGLRPEQDLPSFLRFAGQPTSQRFRAVRQWMIDLAKLAQEWVKAEPAPNLTAQTPAYVDLIFSFGLARLGENDAARELLARARAMLANKDDAHGFLLAAYEYRIRQALDGKPHTGPLPDERLQELEVIERLQKYVVDRLRKHSVILEPDQRINPYRHWGARISDFERALAELTDITDRNELAQRVDRLLNETPKGPKGADQRARVVRAGLEVSPRVGEDFARRMLDQSIPAYDALPETKDLAQLHEQAAFLEKGLFVAGHFGRSDAVFPLIARFQKILQNQKGAQALALLDQVAATCFRGLRKLGMRDEIDQILRQMAELVLEGQDVKAIDFKKYPSGQGPAALRALLQVASGWCYFGRDSQAEPILQAARTVLLANDLLAREQTQLACSYARAVGQAPVEVAQKRLEEIFRLLKGIKDTYTTSTHFLVSQLDVVENVVLAVVSDDFTMGTQARRWLDDDEFLVRRRIHRDLRGQMEKH